MLVLSIDVGIKNLAVCVFRLNLENKTYYIEKWDVFDLCNEETKLCKCETKKGSVCNKKAFYIKGDLFCCKSHAKSNEQYYVPTSEMTMKNIKKKRISELYQLAADYNIEHEEKINKQTLLKLFEKHIQDKYFNIVTSVKVDDMHMVTIGRNITKIFDEEFKDFDIDYVLIENQISPIANKMNTIQGMIAQYFIMSSLCEILFVSSMNKLKKYQCVNMTYKDRKAKSIDICNDILSKNGNLSNMKNIFENHKKKDDLADAFMQGLWYIEEKIFT